MGKTQMKKIAKAAGAAIVLTALPIASAYAGTNGTEFQDIYNKFRGWIQGYAGMAISVASVGLGGLATLAKQTPYPILTGIGAAVLLQYTPDVVAGIMTATI